MLRRLGNPQDDLKFIHIAGTNGKGSTLAYISTVLKEAGYRTGRYSSPAIYSYQEQIQVNEEAISREELARLTEEIRKAGREMLAEGLAHPTSFEVETILAFLYFREKKCDLVVLETGMGGQMDATNVVNTTLVSVLTPISMDHMEAAAVIEETCRQKGCRLRETDLGEIRDAVYGWERQSFSYRQYRNLEIPLAGACQIENAALAVEALEALKDLGYEIPERALQKGLAGTVWKGRFAVIAQNPLFILDGAHNRDAADRLRESIELYFPGRRLIYIMGVLADKEYDYIAGCLAPLAAQSVTVETPDNLRALPARALAEAVAPYNPHVQAAESLAEAGKLAREAAGPEDVIIAFGSLSYLGELNRLVNSEARDTEISG